MLYQLLTTRPTPASAPAPAPTSAGTARPESPARSQAPSTVKIFVNAGKKDQGTPADFVATLTKDLKVPAQDIGRIELRDSHSLIELPAQDAQRIARELTGKTIRRRDLVARLER